jgi:hypothetical protein
MKKIKPVVPMLGILVALGMGNTHAQGGQDSAPTATSAASAPSDSRGKSQAQKSRAARSH